MYFVLRNVLSNLKIIGESTLHNHIQINKTINKKLHRSVVKVTLRQASLQLLYQYYCFLRVLLLQ
jgi:hypothetical protein